MATPEVRRTPPRTRAPLAFLLAAAVLGLLARSGVLDPFDRAVAEAARPGGSWGDLQIRLDTVVESGRPAVAVALAVLVGVVAAARSRSPRPVVVTAGALLVAGVVTFVLQGVLGRADPHGAVPGFDGSYPSGHTVTASLAAGLVVHVLAPGRIARARIASGVAGAVMGAALVLQVAHWATDVVGGLLVSAAVLGLVQAADATPPTVTEGHA